MLEGGSVERDSVDWMVKYNKPKINDYLISIKNTHPHKIYKAVSYTHLTLPTNDQV